MKTVSSTDPNGRAKDMKQFWLYTALRALAFYTVGSFAELFLMIARTGQDKQIVSPIASDLLAKFGILLLASALFGISFFVFRLKGLPSAAKRFFHILIVYLSVLLVVFSLVNGSNLDMQAQVFGYFSVTLIVLAVYGICMLVSFFWRRRKGAAAE